MTNSLTFGGLNNNYAMTFTMNNNANRGWIFRKDIHTNNLGAMSFTTNGKLSVASNARIGYGESDTTIPSGTVLDVGGDIDV